MDGTTINIASGLSADLQAAGATALVLSGPGTGQYRQVLARPNATAVVLSAPLDDHVVLGQSLIAIVATVGGKVVAGNKFVWGSVVQEFGTTMGGIFADNSFDHQNNAFADSGAVDGSLTGFGLCYGSELPASVQPQCSCGGLEGPDLAACAQCVCVSACVRVRVLTGALSLFLPSPASPFR